MQVTRRATSLATVLAFLTNGVVSQSGGHQTASISFELLYPGANEILALFTDDAHTLQELYNHGCWCAKLDPRNEFTPGLGGNDPVDALDAACKNWVTQRKCITFEGGSCWEPDNFEITYDLEYRAL